MLPAVARIVAIGDLHGDMDKTRRAFRVGGLIDEHDRWAGGTTTAVQVLCVGNEPLAATFADDSRVPVSTVAPLLPCLGLSS